MIDLDGELVRAYGALAPDPELRRELGAMLFARSAPVALVALLAQLQRLRRLALDHAAAVEGVLFPLLDAAPDDPTLDVFFDQLEGAQLVAALCTACERYVVAEL